MLEPLGEVERAHADLPGDNGQRDVFPVSGLDQFPGLGGKLGYRLIVLNQIHEADCYSRLGPAGGIRAVVPLHDTATYSTLVTLVNYDSTVTTTANSVEYYDEQLAAFKTQLMNRSGDAPRIELKPSVPAVSRNAENCSGKTGDGGKGPVRT